MLPKIVPAGNLTDRIEVEALAAVEAYAREHGCIGVMLHVFGSNTGARQLYLKAGFDETNVIMLKRVDRSQAG